MVSSSAVVGSKRRVRWRPGDLQPGGLASRVAGSAVQSETRLDATGVAGLGYLRRRKYEWSVAAGWRGVADCSSEAATFTVLCVVRLRDAVEQ